MWNCMENPEIASRTSPDIEKGEFFTKTDSNQKSGFLTFFQKILQNSIPRNQNVENRMGDSIFRVPGP